MNSLSFLKRINPSPTIKIIEDKDGLQGYYINNYSDLTTVVNTGVVGRYLIKEAVTLSANITIPDGVTLVKINPSGKIILGNYDLDGEFYIDCPEDQQLFQINGTGQIKSIVKNSVIYAAWLGIHTDGVTDNKTILEALNEMTFLDWDEKYYVLKQQKIIFPLGHIATSPMTWFSVRVNWEGMGMWSGTGVAGTVFTPLTNGQSHVIKFGHPTTPNNIYRVNTLKMRDITFSSALFEFDGLGINNSNVTITEVQLTDSVLILDHVTYWDAENISFQRGNSRALRLKECWEHMVHKITFSYIGRWDKSLIYIDSASTNNSAWIWSSIWAERIRGSLIESASDSYITDIQFHHINWEFGAYDDDIKNLPNKWDDVTGIPLFKLRRVQTSSITDLEITYLSRKYVNSGGVNYTYNTLFELDECRNVHIDNIQLNGTGKAKLIHVPYPHDTYGDSWGKITNIGILDINEVSDMELVNEIHSNNRFIIEDPLTSYVSFPNELKKHAGASMLENINKYAVYNTTWNTYVYEPDSINYNKQSFIYCDADAWTTSTSYSKNDLVKESGIIYLCLSDHTSGTFSTDLSNGLWIRKAAKSIQSWLFKLDGERFNAITDKRIFFICRVRTNSSSNLDLSLTIKDSVGDTNYTIVNDTAPSTFTYYTVEIPRSKIGDIQEVKLRSADGAGVPIVDQIGFYTKDLPDLYGNTASRPETNYSGQLYYDTDLLKEIVWNGTAWVNTNGTSL